MPESPRLEELRRRLQRDPASLVFAQLAEEHRRLGDFQAAIRVCRVGLARHPEYLSARLTLGRALLAVGEWDQAEAELAAVLRAAPENLTALKGMGELCRRRGELARAAEHYRAARALAPHDPELAAVVDTLSRSLEPIQTGGGRTAPAGVEPVSSAVGRLEAWLAAILEHRNRRHASPR